MTEKKKQQEASIIEIIQKMVKEGESEEKIVKTLKALGVEEKDAKKLLLIGQADTFALIRSEIIKISRDNLEKEKPELQKLIDEEIRLKSEEIKQEVTQKTISELQQYEKDILGEMESFKEQEKEKVSKMFFFGERVKEKINELGTELRTAQLDLEEMKVKGISGSNKNIRLILVFFGIVFALGDLYLLYTSFGTGTSIDSIIVMLLIAMISVTMFFVATVI